MIGIGAGNGVVAAWYLNVNVSPLNSSVPSFHGKGLTFKSTQVFQQRGLKVVRCFATWVHPTLICLKTDRYWGGGGWGGGSGGGGGWGTHFVSVWAVWLMVGFGRGSYDWTHIVVQA